MKKIRCSLNILLLFLCLCLSLIYIPSLASANSPTLPAAINRTIRIGFIDLPGYAVKTGPQTYTGVNAEYAYKIAQLANLNIQIQLYATGSTALEDLDKGRLDMMCNVIKTPARQEQYLFSEHEAGRMAMCVFVRKDEDRFHFGNIKQLVGMTFGAEQTSTVGSLFQNFCHSYGFEPEIRTFPTLGSIKDAVDSGVIDAGLYGAPDVSGYRTIQNFSPILYYFVFRKEDTELKTRVDEAMNNILSEDPVYYDRLVNKYVTPDFTMEMLTREEKTYIAAHPKLVIAVQANDAPYFSLDENNQPRGIVPDFYTKIAQLTGLQPSYKAYESNAEAMQAVTSGTADVLGLYSNGQIPAYNSGLRLTRNYQSVDTVLLTRSSTTLDKVQRVALKGRSSNTIHTTVKNLVKAESITFPDTPSCFAALKNNQVEGFICGMPTATWLLNQNQAGMYKLTTLGSQSLDLCGATAYKNDILCSILSKSISTASYSFNEITTDNTLPESRFQSLLSRIPVTWLTALFSILSLLVLGLIIALIKLRHRQKERDAINQAKIETERREIRITELMKSVEARNSFFSNISHDMRTPLNAILGFTRMAKKENLTDQERLGYLDKVETSGTLLLDLINDTLTISRVSSGKLELHPAPVNPAELFDNIVASIRPTAEAKQISLVADRSGVVNRNILADKLNVEKIFLNLLSNAIKYTPAGGHVWFTIYNEKRRDGKLDSVISVKDDGIGIDTQFLSHLYEPFAQEHRTGYEASGTGLGLSIVKRFVDLMGGTITVDTVKNKGTCFKVRLCFPDAPLPAPASKTSVPVTDTSIFQSRRVLLCEDNLLNQEIACALLKDKGMSVVTAADGKTGLQIFSTAEPQTFDVILMDLHMPVMDGYETTKQIRTLDRADAKTIPILAMTADAFDEDVQKCLAYGMNGHIAKPIAPALLYQALAEVLEKK